MNYNLKRKGGPTDVYKKKKLKNKGNEIDIRDINSVYRNLYGRVCDEADEGLESALSAVDLSPYAASHLCAQWWNLYGSTILNLGWQKKVVVLGANVSGFTAPDGFCPTGDGCRIDFRYLTVS